VHVVIGSDHAGFPLKQPLIAHLRESGHDVADVGSFNPNPVDFPDIAGALTQRILSGETVRGIMVRGIRAAVPHDWHCAHQAVEHDDANVPARELSDCGWPGT
jgi:ribose 5-phosphate isomerase B